MLKSICALTLLACSAAASPLSKSKLPVSFCENKGQIHDQDGRPRHDILFSGNTGEMSFYLKNTGLSYQLYRADTWKEVAADPRFPTMEQLRVPDLTTIYRLDISWVNCNKGALVAATGVLPGYDNYYESTGEVQGVQSFSSVSYLNLYNDINLHYYEKDGRLKYDYIVAARGNYKQIKMMVEGATELAVNSNGELLLSTPLGTIIEQAPVVTQGNKVLASRWVIDGNTVSFDIEGVELGEAFVIDPGIRVWGTYYGGTGIEIAFTSAADASGNVYSGGYLYNSSTGIATSGSHQQTAGSTQDGWLAKFTSGGQRIWGTYYGGTGNENIYGCCVSKSKNVYVCGSTDGGTGTTIATAGSHQLAYGGGTRDGFVVKFDSNGVRQWGTFYGGTGNDCAWGMSCDAAENIYICGETTSSAGIASPGGFQTSFPSGPYVEAFMARFNKNGVRIWGSYYGNNQDDYLFASACDKTGHVFFTGYTGSTVNVVTAGTHQTTMGSLTDGLLVKFDSSGTRQWGTYYGGNGTESATGCSADSVGNVFITGWTSSSVAIASAGAQQSVYMNGSQDAFLVKFGTTGNRLWGTYYGDNNIDRSNSCSADASGNVYMAGKVGGSTSTLIATPGSHQVTYGGGSEDGFIACYNAGGALLWGSYYGDTGYDGVYSCNAVKPGLVYFTGYTAANTGTVIATTGSHQDTYAGGFYDAFLAKFMSSVQTNLPQETDVASYPEFYPNPASGLVTVLLPDKGQHTVYILDMLGKPVKSISAEQSCVIDLSELPAGIYSISVNNVHSAKLIKL